MIILSYNKFSMSVIFEILLILEICGCQKFIYRNPLRIIKKNKSQRCINPNQHSGTCVELWNCQVLLYSNSKFIQASRCGGGSKQDKTISVCCSSDTDFTKIGTLYDGIDSRSLDDYEKDIFYKNNLPWRQRGTRATTSKPAQTNLMNLVPTPPTCGGELIDNRIYGGRNTDIYEFPWMAFLEYSKIEPTKMVVCVGSLINTRYILTAGHCVQGQVITQSGELIAARLGVHDYTKIIEYTDKMNRLEIVQKILHENYKTGNTPINDLALLRLESNVLYSKTIRPICLPSVLSPYSLRPGTELTVVGWGATDRSSSHNVKQKVKVPLVNQTFCSQQFAKLRLNIQSTQLCAGGELKKDSCRGDSGAPLMHYRNGVWVLEGIVSFGRRCGTLNWPGVYTRITTYTKWIMNKLKP